MYHNLDDQPIEYIETYIKDLDNSPLINTCSQYLGNIQGTQNNHDINLAFDEAISIDPINGIKDMFHLILLKSAQLNINTIEYMMNLGANPTSVALICACSGPITLDIFLYFLDQLNTDINIYYEYIGKLLKSDDIIVAALERGLRFSNDLIKTILLNGNLTTCRSLVDKYEMPPDIIIFIAISDNVIPKAAWNWIINEIDYSSICNPIPKAAWNWITNWIINEIDYSSICNRSYYVLHEIFEKTCGFLTIDEIQKMISMGLDILNMPMYTCYNLFKSNTIDVVKYLINDCNLCVRLCDIFSACMNVRLDVVAFLVESYDGTICGDSSNIINGIYEMLQMHKCYDTLQKFIDKFDIDTFAKNMINSHSFTNHKEFLTMLIKRGVDINNLILESNS